MANHRQALDCIDLAFLFQAANRARSSLSAIEGRQPEQLDHGSSTRRSGSRTYDEMMNEVIK